MNERPKIASCKTLGFARFGRKVDKKFLSESEFDGMKSHSKKYQ